MLILSHTRATAERVDLGGGASIMLRPATASDVYLAQSRVGPIAMGLAAGQAAINQASVILGDELGATSLSDIDVLKAAGQRVMLLNLAMICAESWDGIGSAPGVPAPINEENMACLLRDVLVAQIIERVIYRRSLVESDEGNAFAASPSGEAAKVEPTAPNAENSAAPAPAENAAKAESSAPK